MSSPDHVDRESLLDLATRILTALELPASDARLVADSLVTADTWGHASHGLLRLPWYAARLRSGVMTAVTEPHTVVDLPALCVLDGRHGVGQVLAGMACDDAVRRAESHGVGVVAVRNSNHFGTAAYWTRRMAASGCIGLLTTNSSPAMAPWGGKEKTVGANPWSIAAPGGSHGEVVLDISNTSVARGKIYSALGRGEDIPKGWAMDVDGRPTTDPQAALDGLMLPIGEHKGYGISFMMDILSGVLSGSSFGKDVVGPYVSDRPSGCGHLAIALKVDTMVGDEVFAARVDELIDSTKAVQTAGGFAEIFVPGEIEQRAEVTAEKRGVALAPKTVRELHELAASCDVDVDLTPGSEGGPPIR